MPHPILHLFGAKCTKIRGGALVLPGIFEASNLKRTIKEISNLARKKGEDNYDYYCCKHPYILPVEFDHVILDELDHVLRILDVSINSKFNTGCFGLGLKRKF